MTKNPEHIAWDSHWAHLQRAEAPRSRLIPILIKSAYSVLELVPEDEQIGQLRPAVYDGHGVGKQCAEGSA